MKVYMSYLFRRSVLALHLLIQSDNNLTTTTFVGDEDQMVGSEGDDELQVDAGDDVMSGGTGVDDIYSSLNNKGKYLVLYYSADFHRPQLNQGLYHSSVVV